MANTVQLDIQGPIAHVRLHRPGKLNSLTLDTLDQLIAAAQQIKKNRNIRVVILSGSDGNFSAGLDFASALKRPSRLARAFASRPWRGTNQFQEGPWCFRRLPVPVIAVVEGYCFGGGVQIAAAADFRITAPDAQWSVLESKWGLIPDMTGIYAMKQLVGMDVAKKLTMTGEIITGQEAANIGLATTATADPMAAAQELAEAIITRSPDSTAYAKRIFEETWTSGPRTTFFKERLRQARLLIAENTKIAQQAARSMSGSQGDASSRPRFRDRTVR